MPIDRKLSGSCRPMTCGRIMHRVVPPFILHFFISIRRPDCQILGRGVLSRMSGPTPSREVCEPWRARLLAPHMFGRLFATSRARTLSFFLDDLLRRFYQNRRAVLGKHVSTEENASFLVVSVFSTFVLDPAPPFRKFSPTSVSLGRL